ncbi:NAD(P)-dependent oxidoreductase [Nocardia sp. GCM10030253]|uniref:NAD(P)-dependent oxidoreductase n=1 Tax=Nocardia sp. GCM10030253 TaxID=3273404 RepID=UPI003642B77C
MTSESGQRAAVAVLGLGEMGSALANALVGGGHPTAVWNRTPGRADSAVRNGAHKTATARDAVEASELVVVNVKGNAVARDILESAADVIAGRTVVNLTDGTSSEARAVADWATEHGAEYLHGQIMTIAPGIGQRESVLFFGGSETAYDRYRSALALLGGNGRLVSSDAGVPALYGMAVHDTMWGILNGFLHAAALLSDAGIDTKQFLTNAGPAVSNLTAFLPFLAEEIDSGEHATPFGALKHHLPSLEDLVRESESRGIDAEFPGYTRSLVADAVESGHADDSYSRLVDHFRKG